MLAEFRGDSDSAVTFKWFVAITGYGCYSVGDKLLVAWGKATHNCSQC